MAQQHPQRRLSQLHRHLTSGSVASSDDERLAQIRERYNAEREKRLRPDGEAQYKPLSELAATDPRFRRMVQDPWAASSKAPQVEEAVNDSVLVAVIGAGYGGLCAGARLREAGIAAEDIRLIEKASDVGGTWYYNRYPGAACDVESYTYMPLCEEMKYIPTERYAHQPELLQHAKTIAKQYGLYENACFGRTVLGVDWEEEDHEWRITTSKGDSIRARFVVMNLGVFGQPKLPAVPGWESFKGHMFHTSGWDYEYTGGSPEGGLTGLADKRVAIIGTGATAIQAIPHLGASAKELYVFQRTPSTVGVRGNRPTKEAFVKEFLSEEGWQQRRMENFIQMTQTPALGVEDLIDDGWTYLLKNLVHKFLHKRINSSDASFRKEMAQLMELADYEEMERIRNRVDEVVEDQATAAALKPYYRYFCKRPCFHDEYLNTFNLPNVHLVDTDGKGIERVKANGIVANGHEYEVDCVILATGFEVAFNAGEEGLERIGYDPTGRRGLKLSEKWKGGPKTFMSMCSRHFPNLFMLNSPQGVVTTNFVHQFDEASKHISYIIAKCLEKDIVCVEPKEDKEEEWCQAVYDRSIIGKRYFVTCTPGYYNREGTFKVEKSLSGQAPYPPLDFFALLEALRRQDKVFVDLEVTFDTL